MAAVKSGVWSSLGGFGYPGSRQPGEKIRVLIVDDHAGYRRGLRAMLELEDDIEPIGEAGDGAEAFERVEELQPAVVLMDMNMPGVDGLEVTRKLSHAYPHLGVIILTMFTGEEYLREARRAGATAYVLKDAGSEVLLKTIRAVTSGEVPIMQTARPVETGPLQAVGQFGEDETQHASILRLLTANERTILRHLANGLNSTETAHEMGISDEMVRTYLAEIYRKLRLPGRDAAIHLARQLRDTEE